MRALGLLFLLLLVSCGSTTPEQQAAESAKVCYDFLIEDDAVRFLEYKAGADTLPADYGEQLLAAVRQYQQDMNIFQLIQKNNKSLVVVVNKWDLVEDKSQIAIKTFETAIRQRMAPFVDFPIIFASAVTKQRIFKVLETAKQVYLNRKIKIGTSKLNEVMLPIIEQTPPPSIKGKYIKIKYVSQVPDTQIPTFVFYANLPQYVKEAYRRFLENKMRENWTLTGTPINVFIRQK